MFLVDYGSTIEIEVKKKVRKLKLKDQAAEPPLAFKIILEGLYPVSMVNSKVQSCNFLLSNLILCCRILTGCQEIVSCSPTGLLIRRSFLYQYFLF